MGRKKADWTPSNNYCVTCGRYTNDRKFPSENYSNMFFSCNNCKKVWCGSCMGQVSNLGPSKAFRMGKKGQVTCPDCNQTVIMAKLPKNLPFTQQKKPGGDQPVNTKVSLSGNYCKFCGESIPKNAIFCQICGAKQE